ncbi:cytochrome c biogenesis CcdA family protein [Lipingzhangella sp. LS1_29]|uniref:Cytochrome c biogenesis CcdA family protein n=1 Tax=Lipingzhangella rawalii TaxID=2055835 RepID=A0ABU2H4V1_9ACTN|nr:cytochrome c biogenesis CcdA family protein [Lipingzhangella rawalii]MDS1270321.1 cytochrome c biogenesis CcdA family protein [Lipingzhangella rawalii]
MSDIGYLVALLGGVLALLSPCSALLLPSFFAYAFRERTRLLGRTVVFYLGLCLTLVPLGMGSSVASHLFYGERDLLIALAGWLIIAFGLAQIAGVGFAPSLARTAQGRLSGRRGVLSVLALGAVYGFAGFCSGPILGAVLTVAATGTALRGAALLAVYALGMALPLFLLALFWDRLDLGNRSWLRGRTYRVGRMRLHSTSTVSGLLFLAVGAVFLLSDGTASLVGGALAPEANHRIQNWLFRLGDARLDLWLLAAVAAALVGTALVWWLGPRVRARRYTQAQAGA